MRYGILRLRWPTKSEVAVQIVLALFFALCASDFLQARRARSCSEPASMGLAATCYPWGGEGPVAGRWSYASKDNYLRSGIALLLVLLAGILRRFSRPIPASV